MPGPNGRGGGVMEGKFSGLASELQHTGHYHPEDQLVHSPCTLQSRLEKKQQIWKRKMKKRKIIKGTFFSKGEPESKNSISEIASIRAWKSKKNRSKDWWI